MGDAKVENHTFTRNVNAYDTQLSNVKEDSQKVDVNLTGVSQHTQTIEQIPDYVPVENTEAIEEPSSTTRGSYFKNLLRKIWSLFVPTTEKEDPQIVEAKKIDQSVQAIGSRPVLQKPKISHSEGLESLVAALKSVEEKKINKAVENVDEKVQSEDFPVQRGFGSLSEAEVEKLTYEMHQNQINIREKAGVTLKENIIQDTAAKKRLWKMYLDLLEEAAQKAKNSKIFNWISIGAGVIGGAVLIGSLVAVAVASGGVALPAVLAIAGGIAAIAGGGSGIGGAIFKYQGGQAAGNATVMREKQNMKKDEIMAKLQNMEENDNSITQLWSNLGQLLRNTPSNMFR